MIKAIRKSRYFGIFLAFGFALGLVPPNGLQAAGLHKGEVEGLSVSVEFLDPFGFTTTDKYGIHYHVYGAVFHETKIYPSWTYGVKYPLYFMGMPMRFRVHLSNTKEKGEKPFNVRINAVNYVMETTGFSGMMLAPGQDWMVTDLRPGENRVLEGQIMIPSNPDIPSGLDVAKIRIFHRNQGNNKDAGFIKEYTAVWCPPKFR